MTKKALPMVRKNYKLVNVLEGKENEVEIEVIDERKEEEPENNFAMKDQEKNNESNENGKKRNLGSFETAEEGSAAYQQAAAEMFGEFANV